MPINYTSYNVIIQHHRHTCEVLIGICQHQRYIQVCIISTQFPQNVQLTLTMSIDKSRRIRHVYRMPYHNGRSFSTII